MFQEYHTVSSHDRPASVTPFEWRFAGGPMMARAHATVTGHNCVPPCHVAVQQNTFPFFAK